MEKQDISIHAPAKGATQHAHRPKLACWISIHAPAKGATFDFGQHVIVCQKFQSTHPRRVRPTETKRKEPLTNFNPRTREGCDLAT